MQCLTTTTKFTAALVVLAVIGVVAGCAQNPRASAPATSDADRPKVAVVSYAHEYLVRRLVDDAIDVEFPAAESANPATWRPSVKDIASLQSADLIIVNGPGAVYAEWLPRVTLPESRVCHASEELPLKDFISVSDYRIVHQHGPEGEHSHAYMVPYTWLDPAVAARQAEKIAKCLTERWPEHAAAIDENLFRLKTELKQLAETMNGLLDGEAVITTTPQLKYLTRALGADDHHLQWFESPDSQQWQESELKRVQELIQKTGAKLVFTPAPLPDPIKSDMEQAGCRIVPVDLLDRRPTDTSADYFTIMNDLVARIRQAKSK